MQTLAQDPRLIPLSPGHSHWLPGSSPQPHWGAVGCSGLWGQTWLGDPRRAALSPGPLTDKIGILMASLSCLLGSLQGDLVGKASGTEPGSRVCPTRARGYNCSPRSAGQETRLRVLRSLRPAQLTVVEMRQEASLRGPSPGWPCWVPYPLRTHTCPSCPLTACERAFLLLW